MVVPKMVVPHMHFSKGHQQSWVGACIKSPRFLQAWLGFLGCVLLGLLIGLSIWHESGEIDTCSEQYISSADRFRVFNKHNVPPLRDWLEDHGEDLLPVISANIRSPTDADPSVNKRHQCVDTWWQQLRTRLISTCGGSTDTTIIAEVLANMGLATDFVVREAAGELLTKGVSWNNYFDVAGGCLMNNHPLAAYACEALENSNSSIEFATGSAADEELCYTINMAMLVQKLTEEGVRHPRVQSAIAYGLDRQTMDLTDAAATSSWRGQDALRTFTMQKFNSVFTGSGILSSRAVTSGSPKAIRSKGLALATNIMEASNYQLHEGGKMNVAIGQVLATEAMMQLPYTDDDFRLRWELGKDWIDSYNAWDLNIVSQVTDNYAGFAKLLIPAVSCSNYDFSSADEPDLSTYETTSDLYLTARSISLKLAISQYIRRRSNMKPSWGLFSMRKSARHTWAVITAKYSKLTFPATCGTINSVQALLETLYPSDGYPAPPPSTHTWEMLGYDEIFRVKEETLKEQPGFWPWAKTLVAPALLAGFVTFFMLMLENVIEHSGFSSTYRVVVMEAFLEIGKGVPVSNTYTQQQSRAKLRQKS